MRREMATAIGIGHLCSGLAALSCEKRNSFQNHPPFLSSIPSNFATFRSLAFSANLSHDVLFRGYLSADIFCRPTRHPVVCMAKRYAPSTTKRKRLSRKRGGDPDKKHRRRKGSKKKKLFKIIRLVSAAGTGFFYAKKKSRKIDKLELKKYDPKVKRHVVFKEVK